MSLADDVAELFSGLDGYERYELRLAVWASDRIEYRRQYEAERNRTLLVRVRRARWQRQRRREDQQWREKMQRWHRERYAAKNGTLPLSYGPILAKHGTTSGYKRGCRGRCCKDAISAYRRQARAA